MLDPLRYTIVWIAPLEIEARAAFCLLDRKHRGSFPMQRGDDYVFQAGEMCGHNVVIATLPPGQEYGTGSAAALAAQVKSFFPNFWFGLLVGVAAGLPRLTGPSVRDIRLGDVLVALPEGESAGLIAYDLGKETASDGFQPLRGGHVLAMTETVVRAAIGKIKLEAPDDVNLMLPYYGEIKDSTHNGGTFADPGQDADLLYAKGDLGVASIQERQRRPDEQRTRIWYGPIGSGDKLLKSATKRDSLRDRYGLIGLEMEAAGTMNRIPVGVIRGVCDYGDEHKNKEWQPYAAAMAAAYAKAVLAQIGPRGSGSICHIPFERNKNFTGRREQLGRLEQMLFTEQRERAALAGLGGMGKTQIALELAYRVHSMNVEGMTERHSVFWMPAQSVGAYHKAATDVVQTLGIDCGDGDDPKEALQTYLASEAAGHWLLVVDNLDDSSMLDGVPGQAAGLSALLPRSRRGRLLITTRLYSVAVDAAGSDVVKVSSMSFAEAYSLMETLLLDKGQMQDMDNTKELLDKLTYLPLTLAQAAVYMNKTGTPIVRYLQRCRSADQHMIKLLSEQLRDETLHSGAQGAVVTTWIVSFEAVRKTDAGAVRILSFIQWINSKAIPISMLPSIGCGADLDDSVRLLCEYGFLEWREDGETLDMHSLVHLVLRSWSKESGEELFTQDDAIEHIHGEFPSGEWEDRVRWRQLLPHVLPLVKDLRLRGSRKTIALGHNAGLCLSVDGRIRETVDVLEYVVAVTEGTLPVTHPDRLASQHELARAYQANGQVEEAMELLEHVVAIQKKTLTESDPSRLASQHELARVYQDNRQVEKPIKLLEYIVAVQEKAVGENHPSRLASQQELARAYQDNGQVTEAIKLLEYVVAIQKETLAVSHPDRLASEHALARAYQADGQVKVAVELLEYVVAVRKETVAESHPDRLTSQHELARAYQANGQVKKAIELLEHVVAVRKETLAETHPYRLTSQHALARAYQADGQVKVAVELLEYVVAIRKEILPESHPDRLASQHELARAYQADGQVKEAIKLSEQVVTITKETLGATHPHRLASQHELARAYRADGQVKVAIELLDHVVAIAKETLGETHPYWLASQRELALAYRADGQVKVAIELLEHVVAITKKTLGETHPYRLASQHDLAGAYEADRLLQTPYLHHEITDGNKANDDVRSHLKHRFRWWKNV